MNHNGKAAHHTRSDLKCFKQCCISNVVDGNDDDTLWNVRSESEEDEGTDCEDGDSDTDW